MIPNNRPCGMPRELADVACITKKKAQKGKFSFSDMTSSMRRQLIGLVATVEVISMSSFSKCVIIIENILSNYDL